METGGIGKGTGATGQAALPRVEPAATTGSVRTELSAAAAVQAVSGAEAVRFDPSEGVERRAALESLVAGVIRHNLEIDPKTREVVSQDIDPRTGRVVRQSPDQAIMRLRAYVHEMRQQDEAAQKRDDEPLRTSA